MEISPQKKDLLLDTLEALVDRIGDLEGQIASQIASLESSINNVESLVADISNKEMLTVLDIEQYFEGLKYCHLINQWDAPAIL